MRYILILWSVLIVAGVPAVAQDPAPAYIGVQINTEPIAPLLAKHLGIDEGQGILIANIAVDSPADKAGIDKDDIIITLDSKPVSDFKVFVDTIRSYEPGQEVEIELIHIGKRKQIKLKLASMPGNPQWKYEFEPEIDKSWQPGRIFMHKPGDDGWTQFDFNQLPEVQKQWHNMFMHHYVSTHSDGKDTYTITIEGDPKNGNSTIKIKSGDTEIVTKVSEVDNLPDKYKQIAQEAVDKAIAMNKKNRKALVPPILPEKFDYKFEYKMPDFQYNPFNYDSKGLGGLQQQLDEMKRNAEEMEKQYKKAIEDINKQLSEIRKVLKNTLPGQGEEL